MSCPGFLLLRPDCLRSGNAIPLLDHLGSDYGLRVTGLRVLRLNFRQFQALYGPQIRVWGKSAWLHRALLTRGPSAAVLLSGDPAPCPDVPSLLESIKGPSLATERAPNSLRQRFGRQSSFHSVVHCTPDLARQQANIRMFFKEHGTTSAIVPRELWSILLEVDPPTGASVFEAAAHTARRVAASRLLAGEKPSRLLPALKRLLAGLRGRHYTDQRTAFLRFARRHEYELGGVPALASLLGCRPSTAAGAAKLISSLEHDNVPLSVELSHLLQAGMLADINPRAKWEGRRLYPYARIGQKNRSSL